MKKFPGLPAQGSAVQYLGGARIRNAWLKPKAIGRVRGFHKNQEDGARLVVFFGHGHSTILSATHVKPCAAKLLEQSFARVKAKMGKTTKKTTTAKQ